MYSPFFVELCPVHNIDSICLPSLWSLLSMLLLLLPSYLRRSSGGTLGRNRPPWAITPNCWTGYLKMTSYNTQRPECLWPTEAPTGFKRPSITEFPLLVFLWCSATVIRCSGWERGALQKCWTLAHWTKTTSWRRWRQCFLGRPTGRMCRSSPGWTETNSWSIWMEPCSGSSLSWDARELLT